MVSDDNDIKEIKKDFDIEVLSGEEGLIELIKRNAYDILIVATSGIVAV